MAQLQAKIKDLETSIVLLISILKRNNIKLPDRFDEEIDSDVNSKSSSLFTQNQLLISETKSMQKDVEQQPLHIHLVLPPLSQVNSSTILTLTATVPIMSSCVSTMSMDDNEITPPVIASTWTQSLATETDQSNGNVDFSKASTSSIKQQLNVRSSETPITTEANLYVMPSTSKASATIPVTNDLNKNNTVTTATLSSKSITQGFGIDNILVQDINPINNLRSNSSSSSTTSITTTSNTTISTDLVCDKADTSSSRHRLSSSGHTVAALLDSRMSTKLSELKTASNENNKDISKSNSGPSNEQKPAATNSNLNSKARWGNLLENAHSKYHLSSFTLSSNKKQGSKRSQKATKEAKSQSFKETSKLLPTPSSESTAKIIELPKRIPTTSNVMIKNQLTNSYNSSSTLRSVSSTIPLDSIADQESQSQLQTNQPDTLKQQTSITSLPTQKLSENAATQVKVNQPNLPESSANLQHKPSDLNNLSMNLIKDSVGISNKKTHNDAHSKQEIITDTLTNLSKQCEKVNETAKPDIVRTMKDRTIRNKWLTSSVNTMSKATSPTLRIATSECAVEECASPVISYPNVGKRKRKLLFNSTSHQVNDHSIVNLSKGQSDGKNLVGSSQNFTAESLCRSSNVSTKGKRAAKCDIKEQNSMKKTKHCDTLKTAIKKTQFVSSNSNTIPANMLPTILNIFAPAPVPATQQQQQQTFQSPFSNFSAETLAGTENIGVMETGAGNFSVNNFSENMLLTGNSQMFSNFSANSLISGNEPMANMTNMMGQPNSTSWSNTNNSNWMAQDMNDTFFQNMTNVRQPRQQQMLPASTDSSPIKSIMSILNSNSNNQQQPNFQFDPQDPHNVTLPNFFPNNQQQLPNQPLQQQQSQPQQQNQQQQQQQQQIIQMRNMRNLSFNSGDCNDYMMNPWLSANKVNGNVARNPNGLNLPTTANWPNLHLMHNQGSRVPGKEGNTSYNFLQPVVGGNPNNIPPVNNQNVKSGMKSRTGSDTAGPMFGNISLVNSISQP